MVEADGTPGLERVENSSRFVALLFSKTNEMLEAHVVVVEGGVDEGERPTEEIVGTLVDRNSLRSQSLMHVKWVEPEEQLRGGAKPL
jgi:hypothetical protein